MGPLFREFTVPAASRQKTGPPDRTVEYDTGRRARAQDAELGSQIGEYSIDEDFADEVESWLASTTPEDRVVSHGYFTVGTTSDALKSIGVRDGSIYWRKSKMGYIMEEHPEIDTETVKSIPEILENPVVVMKSLTRDDSIVLFGEVTAANGKPVMASLELTPRAGGGMDAEFSLLTSAYGRSESNTKRLVEASDILYLDPNKKRTDTWLMQLRVQFPSGQPTYGPMGSITYKDGSVNIKGKKLSELAPEDEISRLRLPELPPVETENSVDEEPDYTLRLPMPEEAKYSISDELDGELEAVRSGSFDAAKNEVYIGETSNFLTDEIGAEALPVYMPAAKAYAAMVTREQAESERLYAVQEHYHGLGKPKLIEILTASENPVAAFADTHDANGNPRDNLIVLVTDKKINGSNAVVIEEFDSMGLRGGKRIRANKTITVYDRAQTAQDILDAAASGRLLYLDRKRSRSITAGVRGAMSQAAIRDADFTNNIRNFWANVKWQKSGGAEMAESGAEKTPMQLAWEAAWKKKLAAENPTDDENTLKETAGSVKYSTDDEETGKAEKKKPRPVAESRPILAKRDLKKTVLGLFSIPEGQRNELGVIIDRYADRTLKSGALTEKDRTELFDRLYASGVMETPPDPYFAAGRDAVRGGRIYVNDSIRGDFGDDWNSFRKRAFGAGVYLTAAGGSDTGVDVWHAELADNLPGLFDVGELDGRTMLERIVQVAEEGKAENVSLADYVAMLAERDHMTEDELLDGMERQLDWALRTFAEKAGMEIRLRDRTGIKLAQEREAFAEARQKDRERDERRRLKERDDRKDAARRQRENRELRELQQRTLKQLQWLSKNQNRAPEELQETWDEVLGDIDLFAVGAARETQWSKRYDASWKDLAQIYKDAKETDPNFLPSKELEKIVARVDGQKLADMDIGALQDLYKAAVGLRTEFYNRNNVINDEMNRLFEEVYSDSKQEINTAPGGYKRSKADGFINMQQLTPMNVLERMGGWNPEGAFYSMARQLEKGEREMRAYTVQANLTLADFLNEHEDWAKKADGQGKDAIWYELEVPELLELGMGDKPLFGKTVKVYMTPSQKVHMYLESKSYENLRHMAGGRTFADKELYSKGERAEAFAQGKTIRLAPETVKKLVSDLTAEEAELARLLEAYYNSFAKDKINAVSNALYGYDKAVGKNYAPIYTNRNYVKSEIGIYDVTAEGVGNLKSRQYSQNPSYNLGAFDAFERHVDQTARFVGMAVPARNWQTLLNWREKSNSMGDIITHKWGDESKRYITDLITRLQSGKSMDSDVVSDFTEKILSNYISAVFGANPSIVLKQLGSIPLASAYLGLRNVPSPAQLARIDRSLINKYTSELAWRTMGYTTPETKQLKENPNWTQTNKLTRFAFGGGAITAMDGWAASALWPWAENKVRRELPALEVGTQEQINAGQSPFYMKVAEFFNEAVIRSQSVSDEMHQGSLRKSKNPVTRTFTMFKSDASQAYNALRQKVGEAKYYERAAAQTPSNTPQEVAEAAKKKAVEAKKSVGNVFLSVTGGYLWAQAVTFLMTLWKHKDKRYRDDDGELTAGSVAQEMVMGLLGDMAGVVAGGEELAEIIGNIITGDKWYGIETPGTEQLSDIIELLIKRGGGAVKTVKGAVNVIKSGGSPFEYLRRHGGDILGGIEELAVAAATYIPGIPVSNLKAYILGTVKWLSPELAAAYEDALATAEKEGLSGLEGAALEGRVSSILNNRIGDVGEGTAAALAKLYEDGYKAVIPSDTPSSMEMGGEEVKLNAYQQQLYDMVFRDAVSNTLAAMTASPDFAKASDETRAQMVSKLYSYAKAKARLALDDAYEMPSWTGKADDAVKAGIKLEMYLRYCAETDELDADSDKDGKTVSGSKKQKLLTYIDDMNINAAQKDKLYRLAGYAESGLKDAPWHGGKRYKGDIFADDDDGIPQLRLPILEDAELENVEVPMLRIPL